MGLTGTFEARTAMLALGTDHHRSRDGLVCGVAGRIFNEDELRRLYARPDDGTAEVVAAVYRTLGQNGLSKLNGMFALALWDPHRGEGVLVQDQLGVISLFYADIGGRLYFASELRDLLSLLPATPAPDDVSIAHLLANSDPPPGRTPYDGVSRLGGAHLLELDRSGWRRRRYWSPSYQEPLRAPRDELSELLWEAVRRAVGLRTANGVRAGIIMSGGIDSSVVAAAAVATADAPRGYSAVFPRYPQLDESARIDRLVAGIRLENVQYEILPSGGMYAALQYLRGWSVPAPGPGLVLELPLTTRAAADGAEILLDGQGGNEVFGLSPYLLADRVRRGRVISSMRLARQFPLALEHPPWSQSLALWRMFGGNAAAPLWLLDQRRQRRQRSPAHLQPRVSDLFLGSSDPLAWRRDNDGPLWWAFKRDMLLCGREQSRLSEYVLHRAAAAGLEARPPLMDKELVELSLMIPPEADFDSRYDRPLVRDAMARGGVPDDVRLDREKSDLGDFYFHLTTTTDFPFIRQLLSDRNACLRDYVTPAALSELTESPTADVPAWKPWLDSADVESRHCRDVLASPPRTRLR